MISKSIAVTEVMHRESSIFAGRYCFSKLLTAGLRTGRNQNFFKGEGPIGSRTCFLGITVLELLLVFFKILVEEGSYSLDLGMFLCKIS